MAGGIEHPSRQGASRSDPARSTERDQDRRSRVRGDLAPGIVREDAEPPTLAPAPTLLVVTATAGPPPVPTPGEQQRYIVREGDTLSGIAARFGVSEDAILKENPLSDRDRLFVGQELVIPPAQP